MRILAIGAHPDDYELGCGGTLALYKRMGHRVYALVLTLGEASGDPMVRQKACKDAAKALDIDELSFGCLEDTKVSDGIETIRVIEDVVKRLRPDIVFSHSYKDGHQDHRNTSMASLSAARNCPRILLYECPADRDFAPQLFVDITKTFGVKQRALEYLTLGHIPKHLGTVSELLRATEGQARFRGFQAGLPMAEAFEVDKFILDILDERTEHPEKAG